MEKGWKKKFDEVERVIVDGYRQGTCDMDGNSVKDGGGRFVKLPRKMGRVTFHKVYPRHGR